MNRRAWGDFEGLFVADAPIEIMPSARESIRVEGAAALGEFIAGAIEGFEFFQLVFLNSHVAVDGRWRFAERRFDALAASRPDFAVFGFPRDIELEGL